MLSTITCARNANATTQEINPGVFTNLQENFTGLSNYDLSAHLLGSTIGANEDPKWLQPTPNVQNSQAHPQRLTIATDLYKPVGTLQNITPRFTQLARKLACGNFLPFTLSFPAEFPKLQDDITGSLFPAILHGNTTVTPLWVLGKQAKGTLKIIHTIALNPDHPTLLTLRHKVRNLQL